MGELTSDDTLQATLQIIEALGKHPLVLPETPGFVVNWLLFPMISEAVFMLSEGAWQMQNPLIVACEWGQITRWNHLSWRI